MIFALVHEARECASVSSVTCASKTAFHIMRALVTGYLEKVDVKYGGCGERTIIISSLVKAESFRYSKPNEGNGETKRTK